MAKKFGVNIIAFGNVYQLLRSLIFGWDFRSIDDGLDGLGLMMLPLRGSRLLKHGDFKSQVIAMEDAWGRNEFFPALKKFIRDLPYLVKGSPTSQKGPSQADRLAGMNSDGNGTLFDWFLFGNSQESKLGFTKMKELFSDSLMTVHSIDEKGILELHPELRRQVCRQYGLALEEFGEWVIKSKLKVCIDTYHTFQRGSRDGVDRQVVISSENRMKFLQNLKDRVPEVHFRLSKGEVKQILEGKAKDLELFEEMKYMFDNFDACFILEIYPDIFSTQRATARKVVNIWKNLEAAFTS